jgi:polar amino acid transport system substrate-binding protein
VGIDNKMLGVGMVGYAFMGAAHSQAWRSAPRFFDLPLTPTMVAICGRDRAAVTAAADKLGWTAALTDWKELVHRDDVQLVDVCTPGDSHAEIAIAALEAGKHVFCEKPLALTEDELEEVLEAARASGAILAVGFNRRFSPWIIRLAEFARSSPGPISIVYRVNAGRVSPDDWQNDLREGGGRLVGEVCHFIDTIQFLTGEPITEVQCTGRGNPQLPLAAADNLLISLACAGGSIGTIAYLAHGASGVGKERIELFSSAGAGVLDDYRTLVLHQEGSVSRKRQRSHDKGHGSGVMAFIEAVRHGEPPVPLDEVENSSRVTLAAVESLRTGNRIRL